MLGLNFSPNSLPNERMNIYQFIGQYEAENASFVKMLQERYTNITFDESFSDNILSHIESVVKYEILHIILFEKELAIKAELASTDEEFIESISRDSEWIEYFFSEYPVIEKFFNIQYKKILSLIDYIVSCLNNDIEELELYGCCLKDIELGHGDFHGGKATSKLIFNDQNIYFKPRSLKVDNEILDFFKLIEEDLKLSIFYEVKNFDKGNYGWSVPVKIEDCTDVKQVENYYLGMGILTSLSHALNIEDLINDNIISTQGLIALIDLECSFSINHVVNKDIQFTLNSAAGRIFKNSVVNTGIIPRYTVNNLNKFGQSDGSLNYFPKRIYRNVVFKSEIDHSKVKFNELELESPELHIPKLNGVAQIVDEHYKKFLEGFNTGYNYVLTNKIKFEKFLESCLNKKLQTRILWRPTKVYSFLLKESLSHYYIDDLTKLDSLFSYLFNGTHSGLAEGVIESEIEQLKNFDIPVFKKYLGDDNVYDSYDKALGVKYSGSTDYNDTLQKLSSLSVSDYEQQYKIIIQSLQIFHNVENPLFIENLQHFLNSSSKKFVSEKILDASIDYIKSSLYIENDMVSAISIGSNNNNEWELNVTPPGLSNGLDGVALAFFCNAFYTKDYSNLEITEKILKKNYQNFQQVLEKKDIYGKRKVMFSPLQYPTSTFFVNEFLSINFGYTCINRSEFLEKIYQFYVEWIDGDDSYDFVVGCCGSIFVFYKLYVETQNPMYTDLVKLCAEKLYESATKEKEIAYWNSEHFKGLGGFSHGNSSYCVAMLLAYKLLLDQKYYDLFENSLRYDRHFFDTECFQYRDGRFSDEKVFSQSWAHGTAGIGLSRLIIADILTDYPGINEEIALCRTTLQNNIFRYPFSINNGWCSSIEILKGLNRYSGINNDSLDKLTNEILADYYKDAKLFVTDKNHIHLFFNQGLAGLTYFLMKNNLGMPLPSYLILGLSTKFCRYLND